MMPVEKEPFLTKIHQWTMLNLLHAINELIRHPKFKNEFTADDAKYLNEMNTQLQTIAYILYEKEFHSHLEHYGINDEIKELLDSLKALRTPQPGFLPRLEHKLSNMRDGEIKDILKNLILAIKASDIWPKPTKDCQEILRPQEEGQHFTPVDADSKPVRLSLLKNVNEKPATISLSHKKKETLQPNACILAKTTEKISTEEATQDTYPDVDDTMIPIHKIKGDIDDFNALYAKGSVKNSENKMQFNRLLRLKNTSDQEVQISPGNKIPPKHTLLVQITKKISIKAVQYTNANVDYTTIPIHKITGDIENYEELHNKGLETSEPGERLISNGICCYRFYEPMDNKWGKPGQHFTTYPTERDIANLAKTPIAFEYDPEVKNHDLVVEAQRLMDESRQQKQKNSEPGDACSTLFELFCCQG